MVSFFVLGRTVPMQQNIVLFCGEMIYNVINIG